MQALITHSGLGPDLRLSARAASRILATFAVALTLTLAAVALALGVLDLAALKISQHEAGAIPGLKEWFAGIDSNIKWLTGVVAACAIGVVALLFLAGHSRAQDYAIKFGIACGVVAGAGGILA